DGKASANLPDTDERATYNLRSALQFRPDASYLIAGGLGGFGLATARWMIEHGARHLVLVGRNGASTDSARQAIKEFEQPGIQVLVARANVGDVDQIEAVLRNVRQSMPPLKGVFHAPMVIDEGLLGELNQRRFHSVMLPKIAGALSLHRLTADCQLDYFVL